jgi:hypothetical protein
MKLLESGENDLDRFIVSIAFKMSHSLHCVLSHVRQLKVSHYEEM